MANALKPNPGALLRRGIGYALLALSTGCATHVQQPQYPLSDAGHPVKTPQGICVQIGPTPANGKPVCYQLTQPDLQHHVEPLPLDEFGYLFPPLKPESELASTTPPATATLVAPAAAPVIPATAVPIVAAPVPSIGPTAAPSIAKMTVPITKAVPITTLPTIPATAVPIVAAPVPSITPATAPSIASTTVPVTKIVPAPIATTIPIVAAPATTAPILSITAPLTVTPHYTLKTIRFSTRLPFKLNSAHLSRKNRADLLAFVNSLEVYRGIESIRITGHTDKSGPARFNQWLSGKRANSGQLWLLSLGVDPRTTIARGVGSSEPRPHAHNPPDNRYVDLEVVVRVPAP
ncbi:MAG: OmpA family protein [Gammaproteobacteria bacterium]